VSDDIPTPFITEARVGDLVREALVATLPGEMKVAGLVREALISGTATTGPTQTAVVVNTA
jgi:hypothetical protein